MARKYKDRKGVTQIHLFNEVWRIGRLNQKDINNPHCVIYDPLDKQYDVYGVDALEIFDIPSLSEYWNERPDTVDRGKAKVYILSHILDNPDLWEFNLNNKPRKGPVKVIYENGTIKWAEFKGEWENIIIERKMWPDKEDSARFSPIEYKPIAWRKQI